MAKRAKGFVAVAAGVVVAAAVGGAWFLHEQKHDEREWRANPITQARSMTRMFKEDLVMARLNLLIAMVEAERANDAYRRASDEDGQALWWRLEAEALQKRVEAERRVADVEKFFMAACGICADPVACERDRKAAERSGTRTASSHTPCE